MEIGRLRYFSFLTILTRNHNIKIHGFKPQIKQKICDFISTTVTPTNTSTHKIILLPFLWTLVISVPKLSAYNK